MPCFSSSSSSSSSESSASSSASASSSPCSEPLRPSAFSPFAILLRSHGHSLLDLPPQPRRRRLALLFFKLPPKASSTISRSRPSPTSQAPAMANELTAQKKQNQTSSQSAQKQKRHLDPKLEADADSETASLTDIAAKLDLLQLHDKKRKTQEEVSEPWELAAAMAMATTEMHFADLEEEEEEENCCTPAAIPFSWEEEPGKPLKLRLKDHGGSSSSQPQLLPLPPRLLLPPPPSPHLQSALPASPSSKRPWHSLLPSLSHHHHRCSSTAIAGSSPPAASPEAEAESKLVRDGDADAPGGDQWPATPLQGKTRRLNPVLKLLFGRRMRGEEKQQKECEGMVKKSRSECLITNVFRRRNEKVSGERRSSCCVWKKEEEMESTVFLRSNGDGETAAEEEEEEALEQASPSPSPSPSKKKMKKKRRKFSSPKQTTSEGRGGYGLLLRKGSRIIIAGCKALKRRVARVLLLHRRRRNDDDSTILHSDYHSLTS